MLYKYLNTKENSLSLHLYLLCRYPDQVEHTRICNYDLVLIPSLLYKSIHIQTHYRNWFHFRTQNDRIFVTCLYDNFPSTFPQIPDVLMVCFRSYTHCFSSTARTLLLNYIITEIRTYNYINMTINLN